VSTGQLDWSDLTGAIRELADRAGITPAAMHDHVVALAASDSLPDLANAIAAVATGRAPSGTVAFASSDGDSDYPEVADDEFADPGYQEDGKKRYPLNTEERCRAAWGYISQDGNASHYSARQLAEVKARIREAARRFGIQIADGQDDDDVAASYLGLSATSELMEVAARHPELFDMRKMMRASAEPLAPPPPVAATRYRGESAGYEDTFGHAGEHPADAVLRLTADPRSARYFAGARQAEVTSETRAHASDLDEDPTDHAQPSRGGEVHREIQAIIDRNLKLGVFGQDDPQSGSKSYPPPSRAGDGQRNRGPWSSQGNPAPPGVPPDALYGR